ncbi:unnamed protein product [Paramecium primaurelia]|uniref:Uncharacterized protein n=1 Tax=Paramecium primaurelia TaxID=5886 RepID=A0A8S1M676_PARPR|nr:unnamed protein product [Paramecium primaurelia]
MEVLKMFSKNGTQDILQQRIIDPYLTKFQQGFRKNSIINHDLYQKYVVVI